MTLFTLYKIRVTTIYLYLVLFGAVLFTPYKIKVTTIVIGNNIGFHTLFTPYKIRVTTIHKYGKGRAITRCLLHTK